MKLSEMQLTDFVQTLSSDAPAPGGGSASALIGAMGAGLAAMVACLTQGRKKYAEFAEFAAEVETEGKALQDKLLDVMDRDTEAFNAVSAAFAMPKDTEEQKAERSAAIQAGLKACTNTPLECMKLCSEAIALSHKFLESGFNQSSASDLGVAFLSLKTAMQGAWLNVLINLSSIKDAAFAEACRARGQALLERSLPLADAGYEKILQMIQE
ncbi:MAG: cyclodeaminase/cyclohydrolase family protein [Oscillospiraceae bacterium]|nr:cyclodeaminase/cyclohydrolase family protein [Oscillospiraceae bacterium]